MVLIVGSVLIALAAIVLFALAVMEASRPEELSLGETAAVGIALILFIPAALGVILGWRLLRLGAAARVVVIVLYTLFGALWLLFAWSAAFDDVVEIWPVVAFAAIGLWCLTVVGLLFTSAVRREFAAARAARRDTAAPV